jgi:hypothetical protein
LLAGRHADMAGNTAIRGLHSWNHYLSQVNVNRPRIVRGGFLNLPPLAQDVLLHGRSRQQGKRSQARKQQ